HSIPPSIGCPNHTRYLGGGRPETRSRFVISRCLGDLFPEPSLDLHLFGFRPVLRSDQEIAEPCSGKFLEWPYQESGRESIMGKRLPGEHHSLTRDRCVERQRSVG